MKRALRLIGWSALGLLLIASGVLGAVVGVAHGWQRDRLRGFVEARLTDALGEPVRFDALEGVLYREIGVTGLEIGPADARIAAVSRARLRWNASALLQGRVEVSELIIEEPRGRLGGGESFLDGGDDEPEAGGEPPFALHIETATIRGGQLEWAPDADRRVLVRGDLAIRDLSVDADGFAATGVDAEGTVEDRARRRVAFSVRGAWQHDAWRLDEFQAHGAGLAASGQGRGDTLVVEQLHVAMDVTSLGELLELAGVSADVSIGSLKTSLNLGGPWSALGGAVTLRADDIAAGGRRWESLRLEAKSSGPSRFIFDELSLRGGPLAGTVAPGATARFDETRIALEGFDLSFDGGGKLLLRELAFPRSAATPDALIAHPGFGGDLRAERLRLEAFAQLLPLDGIDLAGVLTADLRFRGNASGFLAAGVAGLEDGAFAAPTARAQKVSAEVRFGEALGPLAGRLRASLGGIESDGAPLGEMVFDVAFDERARFEVSDLRWKTDAISVAAEPGSRFNLTGDHVVLDTLTLHSGSQRLVARGRLSQQRFSDLVIELRRLDLPWLRDLMAGFDLALEDETLAGTLTGKVHLNGPLTDPSVRGELQGDRVVLSGVAFDRVDATAVSVAETVELETAWMVDGRRALELAVHTSRADLRRDPSSLLAFPATRVDVVSSEFDLASVQAFAPASVEAIGGRLTVDVSLRGGDPPTVIRGTFALEDGSLKLAGVEQAAAPIALSGTANVRGIVVEKLAIGPEGARLQGHLGLGWPGTESDALSGELRLAGYTLRWPGIAKGKLEGVLSLSGRVRAPVAAGNLVLSEVAIRLPETGAAELKEIRVRSGSPDDTALSYREEEEASPLDPVALDLDVELKANSWVRGRGVEAEIKGNVDVKKRPGGEFTYAGVLQTVRGTYEIYGRRFQIQKAQARLDGGSELDPILNVRALHRVRAMRIFALLEGRLSDPRLRFESEPNLTETDIASYLIFGRPSSEAGARDQAVLQNAAAQIGAGLAGNELERVLGRRLPIDLIDLRFEDGEDQDKELAVGVGKYVGERTFLRYDRRFGREPVDEIRAEYRLTPRWSVESSAASDGEASADILFHLDY